MDDVFVLHHVRSCEEGDDAKLIGVYRSQEAAEIAAMRLSTQAGFIDHPDGWHIDRYPLDKDHWTAGFVTVPG